MERYKFDFVIVGTGLAGLYSALYASKNWKVALITKSTIELSNSYWAQGGIAAAIDKNDSPELHYEDTIKTGRGLCNPKAVEILVNEGCERILELIEMGMPFDKQNGNIALGLEGGHSKRRILHSGGDATGKEIVRFVSKFVENNSNITIFENTLVHKLICNEKTCAGVSAYNWQSKKNITLAGQVILAAGGASAIYQRTTNPHTSVGEGVTLAFDTGAEIESMEFIQFHPTSFYSGTDETFLISEAVRGEGAYIVNEKGERFLKERQKKAELAPRDVISEAIYFEMKKYGMPNVYLDLRHLDAKKIKQRFSNIYGEALKYKVDITNDLVPIAPAAHYMIGGIKTGLNGETNLNGLFAVGEIASTGVHGANRLASNSLLECLVFAKRTVDFAGQLPIEINNEAVEKNSFTVNKGNETGYLLHKNEIAKMMTDKVGIVRSKESLIEAEKSFREKLEDADDDNEYYSSRSKSLFEVARLITKSALLREESRGCHLRPDFPNENDKMKFTIVQKKKEGSKFLSIK
ncbi:MAG: L-aspartate oxidase [Ignavibacteriales bacterium]|nr:L-aspartate oxidase [Ignavibacteriales bacterium]